MQNIIKSIEKSLHNKNWYSALVLSLILPDICGKAEKDSESSSKRYPKWFDKYLGKKYNGFLSGKDCYALRCSFLHEGSNNIQGQRAKEVLDFFVFISSGAHCVRLKNNNFGDSLYDGKDILCVSVEKFCQDMIEATKQWIKNTPQSIVNMLKIHEDEFSINNAIRIQ